MAETRVAHRRARESRMERDPVPQSGVLQVCSRMPERPTMPAETIPDRHTEIAADRTAEAAERTRETAVRTTVAAQRTEASADRRTELAANRTVLAAERTYAGLVAKFFYARFVTELRSADPV